MGPGPAGFKEKIGWQGTTENLGTQRKISKKKLEQRKKEKYYKQKNNKNLRELLHAAAKRKVIVETFFRDKLFDCK